jgi:hypothetical protein
MKFAIFFLIPFNIFCQSLRVERKEKIFDKSDKLLRVDYIFEQLIETDTFLIIDKEDANFLLKKQPFSIEKFQFFKFERYLILSNSDTIKCENEYDHFYTSNKKVKKYTLKNQDKIFYKVNIYNDYFTKEAVKEYNKLKNTNVNGKEIILKIFNQKTQTLNNTYAYKIE